MVWNVVAVILACLALASSTVLAVEQARLSRRANHIPAHFDLAAQFRSLEFNDHYQFVTTRLAAECDPHGGISGLSDEARAAVYDVAGLIQGIASLRVLDILDDRVLAVIKVRAVRVWESVAPFVLRERELQGTSGQYLWRLLEEFAADAAALPDDVVNSLIDQQRRARNRYVRIKTLRRRSRLPRRSRASQR